MIDENFSRYRNVVRYQSEEHGRELDVIPISMWDSSNPAPKWDSLTLADPRGGGGGGTTGPKSDREGRKCGLPPPLFAIRNQQYVTLIPIFSEKHTLYIYISLV